MGFFTIDGRPIGDVGLGGLPHDLFSATEAMRDAERRQRANAEMARILAGMRIRAAAAVRATIKDRARAYRLQPERLEYIAGLTARSRPAEIIATCDVLLAWPRVRHAGFGGDVPTINLLAARLYARWLRRVRSGATITTRAA